MLQSNRWIQLTASLSPQSIRTVCFYRDLVGDATTVLGIGLTIGVYPTELCSIKVMISSLVLSELGRLDLHLFVPFVSFDPIGVNS